MAVKVESPEPEILDGIDLQLFGVFDIKSEESLEAASAQASEAPDDDIETGEAQEETPGDQEQPEEEVEAYETTEDDDTEEEVEAQAKEAPSTDQWVVPGKFRTWEDVLRAQQNAEQQLGRLHREMAQMRREGASQSEIQDQEQKIQSEEERAQLSKELLREFLKDPVAYNERLKREILQEQIQAAQLQRQQTEQRLQTVTEGIGIVAGKYSDFAEIKDAVEKVIVEEPVLQRILTDLQKDPNATATDYASLLDAAYRIAKSESAGATLQAVREQGRREAQQQAHARQSARTAGQSVRRDQTQESEEDRIRREIREAGGTRGIWED